MKPTKKKEQASQKQKKPYTSPTLTKQGTLAQQTLTGGNTSSQDNPGVSCS